MAKKIKVNIYDDMRQSLQDAAAYERGERVNLRVTKIPDPPKPMKPREIVLVRVSLNASQPMMARLLGVSAKAVQSWEQGARKPNGAVLRLLTIAKNRPRTLLDPA